MNGLSILIALAGAALGALIFWLWQRSRQSTQVQNQQSQILLAQSLERSQAQMMENMQRQTQGFHERLDRLSGHVQERLEAVSQQVLLGQKTVGERLENAAEVVGQVQKSLGSLGQAAEKIFEVGKNISSLEDILKAPKMRGGLGEFFLADLLSQILPAKHYTLQHGFRSGQTVDAAIHLGTKWVPVDSKFPLENFRRVLSSDSEETRKAAKKKFVQDVKKHVDAIAAKYILPDEGTYDFALMYIPAENVYYEVIIKDMEDDNGLTEYALARHVIPVSPHSFYAYLQAIVLGLRGFQIEENAQFLLQNVSRLKGEFDRFQEEFAVLGKHMTNARDRYEQAQGRLDKLSGRLAQIEQSGKETAAAAPVLDAPAPPPLSVR